MWTAPRREASDRHDRPMSAVEFRARKGVGAVLVGVDAELTPRCAQNYIFEEFFESFCPRAANDLDHFFCRIVEVALTFLKKHRIVIDSDFVRLACARRFQQSGAVSDDRRTHKRSVMLIFAEVSHGTSVDPTPSIPVRRLLETGGMHQHKACSIHGLRSSDLTSAIRESPRSGSPPGRPRWLKRVPKVRRFEPPVRDPAFFPARSASVFSPEQRQFSVDQGKPATCILREPKGRAGRIRNSLGHAGRQHAHDDVPRSARRYRFVLNGWWDKAVR